MSNWINHANETAQVMLREIAKQKETIIMEQLVELTSRGLLVIEQTEPVLVETQVPGERFPKIELKQLVKLKLKDQEYIESLEARVKELEDLLAAIKKATGGIA